MLRWITSVLAQNVTIIPARPVPSQNCLPRTSMFPLGGTGRANSTGPPRYGPGGLSGTAVPGVCGSACGGSAGPGGAGARARTAGNRSGSSSRSASARVVLKRSPGTAIPIA